jgi:ribosome maturation factor RimP
MKGNGIRSLLYFQMKNETQIQVISGMVTALLENDPGYFLVEVRIAPGNNIQVFVDGDNGITIDKCVALNRSLYKLLEESATFSGADFSLEVSSPGLDEPLKLLRQFQKNLGRHVEVVLKDGTKKEGKLEAATDNGIVVEEKIGRKIEVLQHNFLFENIKTTKIQVVF